MKRGWKNTETAERLAKWATDNLMYRTFNKSTESVSTYFNEVANTNVVLRISDHLRLEYNNNIINIICNPDGTICAMYNRTLYRLDSVADAKSFIKHLELLATVKVGKAEHSKAAINGKELMKVKQMLGTNAVKMFLSLETKEERAKVLSYIKQLKNEKKEKSNQHPG